MKTEELCWEEVTADGSGGLVCRAVAWRGPVGARVSLQASGGTGSLSVRVFQICIFHAGGASPLCV